jgi:hypothetical protein
VGVVALGTLVVLERRMKDPELLTVRLRLFMTAEAKICGAGAQQRLMAPGVGRMAGEAPFLIFQRLVLVEQIRTFVFMAREAQVIASLHQQHRLVGCVRIMAVHTRAVLKGPMLERGTLREVHRIVTREAELTVLLGHLEGIRVVGSVVA